MRIIAGSFKGRVLKAPKGSTTRPTTDRVRESLMSTISSARGGFEGAVVLDVFAGSGVLGLEAMSRGAESVTFYEKDAGAIRILRSNIATLNLSLNQCAVFQTDVMKYHPRFAGKPFDIVFLDPPYTFDPSQVCGLVEKMNISGVLDKSALISYEHAKTCDSAVEKALNLLQWEIVSHKSYGDTSIDIFQCKDEITNTD